MGEPKQLKEYRWADMKKRSGTREQRYCTSFYICRFSTSRCQAASETGWKDSQNTQCEETAVDIVAKTLVGEEVSMMVAAC